MELSSQHKCLSLFSHEFISTGVCTSLLNDVSEEGKYRGSSHAWDLFICLLEWGFTLCEGGLRNGGRKPRRTPRRPTAIHRLLETIPHTAGVHGSQHKSLPKSMMLIRILYCIPNVQTREPTNINKLPKMVFSCFHKMSKFQYTFAGRYIYYEQKGIETKGCFTRDWNHWISGKCSLNMMQFHTAVGSLNSTRAFGGVQSIRQEWRITGSHFSRSRCCCCFASCLHVVAFQR